MPGLYHVFGSGAVLVCGLLGNWNLKVQVETTQQEQPDTLCCAMKIGNEDLSSVSKSMILMAVLAARGCVSLSRATVGYAYPKSHPSGELVVIHCSES